jgi:hypothetical protein
MSIAAPTEIHTLVGSLVLTTEETAYDGGSYQEIYLHVGDSEERGRTARLALSADEARNLVAALTARIEAIS